MFLGGEQEARLRRTPVVKVLEDKDTNSRQNGHPDPPTSIPYLFLTPPASPTSPPSLLGFILVLGS